MMKKIIAIALLLTAANVVSAQKYMTRTGKVTFFSGTKIENIEAFNNETAAIVDSKTGNVIFQVPVKSFKFEKQLMQDHFNEDFMESDKYPKAEFNGKITNISAVNFSKDGVYNVTVAGKLTIHGVANEVSEPGTITVKGKDITANTKFFINLKDYKVKVPSVAASKIAEKIEITVNSILESH